MGGLGGLRNPGYVQTGAKVLHAASVSPHPGVVSTRVMQPGELGGEGLLKGQVGVQQEHALYSVTLDSFFKRSDKPLLRKATFQKSDFHRTSTCSRMASGVRRSPAHSFSPLSLVWRPVWGHVSLCGGDGTELQIPHTDHSGPVLKVKCWSVQSKQPNARKAGSALCGEKDHKPKRPIPDGLTLWWGGGGGGTGEPIKSWFSISFP